MTFQKTRCPWFQPEHKGQAAVDVQQDQRQQRRNAEGTVSKVSVHAGHNRRGKATQYTGAMRVQEDLQDRTESAAVDILEVRRNGIIYEEK